MFGDGLVVVQRAADATDLAGEALGIDCELSSDTDDCETAEDWSGLSHLVWRASPYSHAFGRGLFTPKLADEWLTLLEETTCWKPANSRFYSAEATAIDSSRCPAAVRALLEPSGIHQLEQVASAFFNRTLRIHGPVVAHRMVPGHSIGVHSDRPAEGEETHRIIVFIAREPKLADGGHFLLLDGSTARSARAVLVLAHNTAVAFDLDERSYHAVTRLAAGVRFSLIISLRSTDAKAATPVTGEQGDRSERRI